MFKCYISEYIVEISCHEGQKIASYLSTVHELVSKLPVKM